MSYYNSVYNTKIDSDNSKNENQNVNLNESKELKEINNRLGYYINSVKDLTQYLRTNPSQAYNQNHTSNNSSNTLFVSMKNLEQDLESFKQVYDEEIKLMKFEIEELSIVKNKYSLENFNLDLKLKDFVVKFEDIKKTNGELENELNEAKSKYNRLEFELENYKLEAEKPSRENKQLKKDLDDLINKLNEKQAISDSEITYRQELETKFKELRDSVSFEKRLNDQEIENFKSQSKLIQETINELETKFADASNREAQTNDELKELKNENTFLRSQNQQLNEQNESLSDMCKNLESVIQDLEQMKKILEQKISMAERNTNQSSLSSEINSIKSKLEAEEFRLMQLASAKQQNEPLSRFSFNTNTDENNEVNDQARNITQRSSLSKPRQSVPFGQITNFQTESKQIHPGLFSNNQNNQNKHYLPIVKSPEQHSARFGLNSNNNNNANTGSYQDFNSSKIATNIITNVYQTSELLQNPVNYSLQPPLPFQQSHLNPNNNHLVNNLSTTTNQIYLNNRNKLNDSNSKPKDITNDLFNFFEKTTLFNQPSQGFKDTEANSCNLSSIDNTTVTEASYVGNVKIHEVNKNGYFIRILNVSNTNEEDLSSYTIQQMVSTMPVAVFRLPYPTKLSPGHTITIWARTDEVEQQPPHTFIWYEQDKWGTGPECTTILSKPNGQAVSWTTGCHKYGNIDYDEIVPVYSQKRGKSTALLDRTKLVPQKLFTPTKHPHGSNSRLGLNESTNSPGLNLSEKLTPTNTGFQRNFFSNQKSRPINSESSIKTNQRPQSSLASISSTKNSFIKNSIGSDNVYQENLSYY